MYMSRRQSGPLPVSYVNVLIDIMIFNPSPAVREQCIRSLLQHGLLTFVQLAAIRCRAVKLEQWLSDHPEIQVEIIPWEDVGYDGIPPFKPRRAGIRANQASPVPLDESNLRVARVRRMDHASDELLQQRQTFLPDSRHLPSPLNPPVPASAHPAPPTDPTPRTPSRLRRMVSAEGDERLTEMYDDFEKFRRTGSHPERKNTEEGPPTKRYRPSKLSDYRPYSLPSTPGRGQAGAGPVLTDQSGSELPPTKRLGSTELFPDRYQVQEANAAPDETPDQARDSVSDSADIKTRDFAYPQTDTSLSHDDSEGGRTSLQSADPESSSDPPSRRAAARSDSDLSSASSTESSRARKALAVKFSGDKSRVELNSGKSTASVGFTSNAPTLFQNFVNTISPSSSKSSAEDVTRKLSKSPTRQENRFGRDDGSRPCLDGANEGEESAVSSGKRSRGNSVTSLPSKRQQKQPQTGTGIAPAGLLLAGILPDSSEACEESPSTSSSQEGTIEDGEGSHSNPVPKYVYPTESESSKPRF